jgi:hypothetical protein
MLFHTIFKNNKEQNHFQLKKNKYPLQLSTKIDTQIKYTILKHTQYNQSQ